MIGFIETCSVGKTIIKVVPDRICSVIYVTNLRLQTVKYILHNNVSNTSLRS
jgi:hypothetical protein